MALLKLGDKYSVERLELVYEKALVYTCHPNYESIQTILKMEQDKVVKESIASSSQESLAYRLTRGAEYYGRQS